MNKELCFSFCEVTELCQDPNLKIEELFEYSYKIANYQNDVKRVYIGSNFCGQYFLHIIPKALLAFKSFCEDKKIKITLCIPIFSQKNLGIAKKHISDIISFLGELVDEITVNDYGMLNYISSQYSNIFINLGRLFHKDTRDIRYGDYYNSEFTPSLFSLSDAQTNHFQIKFHEIDPTHSRINLNEICQPVAIYTPYCYVTVGQICEFASIDLPIEKKFRPNSACNMTCNKVFMKYINPQGDCFYKIGRTVYYKNDILEVLNADSYREIFELLELKRFYYEQ